MRRKRHPTADPRSTLPRRARSLGRNGLGPDGARALAPALEKMVGLKKLKCVANLARQPTLAQPLPTSSDPLHRSIKYENELGDGLAAIQAAVPEGCKLPAYRFG